MAKKQKGKNNPQNKKDGRCFQYAFTVVLNHKQIKVHPERISKIRFFIDKYNWKDIIFHHIAKTGKY